jgi:Mrp family chromosome partitioning ATPase
MSRPPALDPDAERWAARFETINPPGEVEEPPREPAQRKRSGGRWTTQVMGSMVPLEAGSLRDERPPDSLAAPSSVRPQLRHLREQPLDGPLAHIEQRDVPFGWTPRVDSSGPVVAPLCEALLQHVNAEPLRVAVTGDDAATKAQLASALALGLAGVGAKVLLVEADFDNPQLHQTLTITVPGGGGFSQQLAVRRVDTRERPWVVMRCSANLQVLAEGRLRSPGLTLSEDFARALHELSPSYQVVVIHAPGLSKHHELSVLDTLVHAAVVAKAGIAPTLRVGQSPLRAP